MIISTFAISHSVNQAAAFHAVCSELNISAFLIEDCGSFTKIAGLKPGYEPPEEWKKAVCDYYLSLHRALTYLIDAWGSGDIDYMVTHEQIEKLKAIFEHEEGKDSSLLKDDVIKYIVSIMNIGRRWNDASVNYGDIELSLTSETVKSHFSRFV